MMKVIERTNALASENPALANLLQQLKSSLLKKDVRIEALEVARARLIDENKRLRNACSIPINDLTAADHITDDPTQANDWPALSSQDDTKAVQLSEAIGYYQDKWANSYFQAQFRATENIGNLTLCLWSNTTAEEHFYLLIEVMIDDIAIGVCELQPNKVTTFSFDLMLRAGEIFSLRMTGDAEAHKPPDTRALSFQIIDATFI